MVTPIDEDDEDDPNGDGKVEDNEQVDNDGDKKINEDPDWPGTNQSDTVGRPRTAIAWDNRGHFYLIAFEGGRDWGLTWGETRNLFRHELPRWMADRNGLSRFVAQEPAYEGAKVTPQQITIQDAIMLDGSGSTQSAWRWAKRRRRPDGSWVNPIEKFYQGAGRAVPTLVDAYAVAP